MSQISYLIHGSTKTLRRLDEILTNDLVENNGGLIPISSRRGLISARTSNLLVKHYNVKNMSELFRVWRITDVEPVSQARVSELLKGREPEEFSLMRKLNESGLEKDWHLESTRIKDAWGLLGGPDNIDWQNIKVGQIDTGYTENTALGWQDNHSPWVLTDQDKNVFYDEINTDDNFPWSRINTDPNSALDPLSGANAGHGTRTASVLSGFDGTQSNTYYGAAPKIPYVPVRISNSVILTGATGSELQDALKHLMEIGCNVITMSLGAAYPFKIPRKTRKIIDQAYEKGIIFCCAAGNIIDPVVAPARNPRTLAIGGCTPSDSPWSGSSFGHSVDICAPASPIYRASTDKRGNSIYGWGDGTSYATPQVAATASMWLLRHWDVLQHRYQGWKRVEAFKYVLKKTAKIPAQGWDTTQYGEGILDAYATLQEQLPDSDELVKDERPH